MALRYQPNVRFLAYEGGPSVQEAPGLTPAVADLLSQAARDPRNYQMFSRFLDQLDGIHMDLFNNFEYTDIPTYGIWGALDRQDQPLAEAHKYRALLDYVYRSVQSGTATSLSSDIASAVFGQAITLTARVAADAPRSTALSGGINFFDGATLLGSATLVNGAATFRTAALGVGSHALRAVYSGDTSYLASTGSFSQTVNQAASQATLSSSAAGTVFGQPVSFTARVTAAAPGSGAATGSVTFRDGSAVLGTVYLVGGTTTFTTTALGVGAHAISAEYNGDGNFRRAMVSVRQTVSSAPTAATLVSSASPAMRGQTVTFTATVRAGGSSSALPIGTVTFRDGNRLLATVALNASGVATFATSALSLGSHAITAIYSGNANFRGAGSSLAFTVSLSPTTTTLVASANPIRPGQPVTLTATVRAGGSSTVVPGGTVTFRDSSRVLGTVSLNGRGVASFRVSALSPGSHRITATYNGNSGNCAGSSSAPLVEVVSASAAAQTLPVLVVIGNQDFYYREYADTRSALEQAGLRVAVAAATTAIAVPHADSGQGADSGLVRPDFALGNVRASDYSAIVFIGGWGASAYQYAFEGTYDNPAYNLSQTVKDAANNLINDFVHLNKYVAGICHGVSVLAWSRVNGQSLLAGRTVAAFEGAAPDFTFAGAHYQGLTDSTNETLNGGTVFAPMSIGNPTVAADDVYVDPTAKIITAENWDSATLFGQTLAQRLLRG